MPITEMDSIFGVAPWLARPINVLSAWRSGVAVAATEAELTARRVIRRKVDLK